MNYMMQAPYMDRMGRGNASFMVPYSTHPYGAMYAPQMQRVGHQGRKITQSVLGRFFGDLFAGFGQRQIAKPQRGGGMTPTAAPVPGPSGGRTPVPAPVTPITDHHTIDPGVVTSGDLTRPSGGQRIPAPGWAPAAIAPGTDLVTTTAGGFEDAPGTSWWDEATAAAGADDGTGAQVWYEEPEEEAPITAPAPRSGLFLGLGIAAIVVLLIWALTRKKRR